MISPRPVPLIPALALLAACGRASPEPAPSAVQAASASAGPSASASAAAPGASASAVASAPRPRGPRVSTATALRGKADLALRLAVERDGDEIRGFLVADTTDSGTHLSGTMLDEKRFRMTEVGKRKHPSSLEGELVGVTLSKVSWDEGKGKPMALKVAPLEPFRKDEPGGEIGYAGAIGERLRIRVQLRREGKALSGYYRYARSREDLKLAGTVDPESGRFDMAETDAKGAVSGRMRGRFLRAGQIVGLWISSDGARTLPLWMSATRPLPKITELPGGGKILPRERESTVAPHCTSSILFPELDGLSNRKAQDALNKELNRASSSFGKESCEGATAERSHWFEESFHVTSSRRKTLLGIAFSGSEYTGGAHPMSYQSCSVLDLEQGQRFDLSSLLEEGAHEKLSALASAKLRKEHRAQDLTEAGFFDSDVKVGKSPDLCLHDDHITLVFSLYEVAPYAMGMPQVDLSFDEVRPLLKKGPRTDALLR